MEAINFNHKAEKLTEALGITDDTETMSDEMKKIMITDLTESNSQRIARIVKTYEEDIAEGKLARLLLQVFTLGKLTVKLNDPLGMLKSTLGYGKDCDCPECKERGTL